MLSGTTSQEKKELGRDLQDFLDSHSKYQCTQHYQMKNFLSIEDMGVTAFTAYFSPSIESLQVITS